MRNRQMQKIMALLAAENGIIRRGDLERLPDLVTQKALLMRDVTALQASAAELNALRSAAERNAQLLAAAMAGVNDAQKRLTALDEMRAGLSIYDAQGNRETVASPGKSLERKA